MELLVILSLWRTLTGDVAAGRLRVRIQRTFRLEQAPQALADFAAGKLGKLAVTIG